VRNSIKLLWIGIGVLLLVLGINAYVRLTSLGQITRDNQLIRRTDQTLLQTEVLQNLLVDAETGQRGYLYTGDKRYREPYNRAIREIEGQIDRVAALTADNPHHQARVQQLRELSRAKLAEMAKTIKIYDSGRFNDAQAIVLSDAGQNTMDDIRRVLGELESEERALREIKISENQANTASAFRSFIVATTIAVAALLAFGFLLSREMRKSRAAALAVLDQKEWLYVTLRSIGDAVLATDVAGRVEFLNDVAAELTGYSSAEAQGRLLREIFPIFAENTRQAADDPVAKVISTGAVVGLANHTILRRRDGREIAIDDSAAPIRNRQGDLLGVVLVFRDVTGQRETDVAMRKAEKLATAGRFAATIAHEINNPLEAVMNSLFLLGHNAGITPQGREYLLLAQQELSRVAVVARQTLAFYKDTSAHTWVDIPQLLDGILSLYGSRMESRGIHLVRQYPASAMFFGSAGELRQVFSNLILNSVDALHRNGRLTLKIEINADTLRVQVEDDGIGIPQENLSRIFEPFFTTKKDVGTGLGLWMAKNLVEKYHGELQAESSAGRTRFTVLLPVSQDAAQHAAAS
jgi:PAS domain S-box-containing protein